jgi:hypothetical protein
MDVTCGLDERNKKYRILLRKLVGKWPFAKPSS